MDNDEKLKGKITKAKMLIGQEIDENLLSFYFDLIEQKVKNYCNRNDVPEGLELIVIEMVAAYSKLKFSEQGGSSNDVSSIKRGDTTITYKENSNTADISISSFVFNYERQLNQYRKVGTI